MTKKLNRVWISREAKKAAKIRAAEEDKNLVNFFDDILLGSDFLRRKKGGGNSFF